MMKNKRINKVKEQFENIYLNKDVQYTSQEIKKEMSCGNIEISGFVKDDSIYEGVVISVPASKRKMVFIISFTDLKIKNAAEQFVINGIESYALNTIATNNSNELEEIKDNEVQNFTNDNEVQGLRCIFKDCDIDEELQTSPCTACGKPVHHLCSNAIREDELSNRFCSFECSIIALNSNIDKNKQANESNKDTKIVYADVDLQESDDSEDNDIDLNVPNDPLDVDQQYECEFENINEVEEEKQEDILGQVLLDKDVNMETLINKKSLKSMVWDMNGEVKEDSSKLYKNNYRIKAQVVYEAPDPFSMFMILFPQSLWETITIETNRYREQKYNMIKEISTNEIMKYVGLLIARSLHPWVNGLKNHWRERSEGM